MSANLIASLRALSAAQHSDLTVAADAADRIERLSRERDEARAGIERLSKAHESACGGDELLRAAFARLLERLTRERDEARAWAAKLLATLEMVRDADNDCRIEGWATIPDAARRSIDEALEAKP